MKAYTDITVLLDRSGSMGSIKESMEAAFNNFIKEHKEVPTTRITLIQFDDINDQDVVYQNVPITAAEKLKLKPRGNTPLLDATCKTIDATGARLARMDEADRPDQVLMVIITDGQENSSFKYNRAEVFKRVTNQRNNFKWQFVYLGANQDTFAEAASIGIPWKNTIKWSPAPEYLQATSGTLSCNTMSYVSRNTSDVPDFTESQRSKSATKADLDADSTPSTGVKP